MVVNTIKFVLQIIGLGTIIWFVWIVIEEYRKIQQEHKEKNNGQSHGL